MQWMHECEWKREMLLVRKLHANVQQVQEKSTEKSSKRSSRPKQHRLSNRRRNDCLKLKSHDLFDGKI